MNDLDALAKKHAAANKRWTQAVFSPRYPEDEDKPLTEEQKRAWRWANAWRRVVHETEKALQEDPRMRAAFCEGAVSREEPTYYEAMVIPGLLPTTARKKRPFIPVD